VDPVLGLERYRRDWVVMGWVLLLLASLLLACGGSGKAADPPSDGVEQKEGRVVLDNQTIYAVEVSYLNQVDAEQPRIVRVQVEPGARQDVSQEVLPGGLEVEFDLVLLLPTEMGYRVRRKAQTLIDGDVVLRLSLEDENDPFSLRIDKEKRKISLCTHAAKRRPDDPVTAGHGGLAL
jgi:hypothetical protein